VRTGTDACLTFAPVYKATMRTKGRHIQCAGRMGKWGDHIQTPHNHCSRIYARNNDLLNTAGWKRFKQIAKNDKKLLRMANQAKLRSFRTAPWFKYGFEIPKDYDRALFLDRRNGNSKWQDANKLEFDQLDEYETFEDMGPSESTKPPDKHKKIRVHLVFDVKHNSRHKVRCVADGHFTDIPLVDSVYSGVVRYVVYV
jgi:hypothetical protein